MLYSVDHRIGSKILRVENKTYGITVLRRKTKQENLAIWKSWEKGPENGVSVTHIRKQLLPLIGNIHCPEKDNIQSMRKLGTA